MTGQAKSCPATNAKLFPGGTDAVLFTVLCLRGIRQKTKPSVMVLHANRRWLCLLTALLFAISSMAHAYAMTDASMKMPSAAMESSAPDHGMDCGGNDKAPHAACVAMCATAVAILSEPVAMTFVVAMRDIAPGVNL
jgi:hypothetical protein